MICNHNQGRSWAKQTSKLILGGQDGLVNVLGIVLGVSAASSDTKIILAAGLAATFAESISMGAVAYTSYRAEADYYKSEYEKEKQEIKEIPKEEREEVREIYRQKGFDGQLLEQVVDKITSDRKQWSDTMMKEELKLEKPDKQGALRAATIVFTSAMVGSLIPIAPFFLWQSQNNITVTVTSVAISALALLGIGIYKAKVTIGSPLKSGFQMVLIGILSALGGYIIGLLFSVDPKL